MPKGISEQALEAKVAKLGSQLKETKKKLTRARKVAAGAARKANNKKLRQVGKYLLDNDPALFEKIAAKVGGAKAKPAAKKATKRAKGTRSRAKAARGTE